MALIKTINLSKDFSRGSRNVRVLNNIQFSIDEGEYIHITGRSGSGKTTFLNLISAILNPTTGQIYVEEKDLTTFDDEAKSRYRNNFIGYVPQSLGAMGNLSAIDNVRLPYFLFGERSGDGIERASMLLDMVGILHLKDQFPRQLSGGEIKRLILARALMNNPRVLIADELTSDLDKQTTIEIMELLKTINEKGTALIIVTHELDILKYGKRVFDMQDGVLTEKQKYC